MQGQLLPLIHRVWASAFSKGDAHKTLVGDNLRPGMGTDLLLAMNNPGAAKSNSVKLSIAIFYIQPYC